MILIKTHCYAVRVLRFITDVWKLTGKFFDNKSLQIHLISKYIVNMRSTKSKMEEQKIAMCIIY